MDREKLKKKRKPDKTLCFDLHRETEAVGGPRAGGTDLGVFQLKEGGERREKEKVWSAGLTDKSTATESGRTQTSNC